MNNILMIDNDNVDNSLERCYICLENLNTKCYNNKYLKCGCLNRYHINCLYAWCVVEKKCPICKKKINETQNQDEEHGDFDDYEEDNFELELDDNDIFYNPLYYFISVYIVHFIVLFSIDRIIYTYF